MKDLPKDSIRENMYFLIIMSLISLPFVISYGAAMWMRYSLVEMGLGIKDGFGDLRREIKEGKYL